MGSLCLIAPWHGRVDQTEALVRRVLRESSRRPDEFRVVVEDEADLDAAWDTGAEWLDDNGLWLDLLPTPILGNEKYAVIPYSHKINFALDRTDADYIAYLDNGSMPHPDKYRIMVEALDEHPEWGAVYCTQKRTGYNPTLKVADHIEDDAFCKVNFTAVVHRRTADRWSTDMRDADPDLADAIFWRDLHKSLGPFYPVAPDLILDEHHIESEKAAGI